MLTCAVRPPLPFHPPPAHLPVHSLPCPPPSSDAGVRVELVGHGDLGLRPRQETVARVRDRDRDRARPMGEQLRHENLALALALAP